MTTYLMYDAAYPPGHPPAWPVVAGYLGGDTPHVWSLAEWEHQPARYRLPIWVRSNPDRVNADDDAAAAVRAAKAVGVPHGATIALDFETAVNGAYVGVFDRVMTAAGYRVMLYGSASTVRNNRRPSGGYWVADWTGHAHMDVGAEATQWTNGSAYDSSLILSSVPLWDSRPPAPAPAPRPAPSPAATLTHEVWLTDGVIPVPDAWDPGNDTWAAASILVYAVTLARELRDRLDKLAADVDKIPRH